MKKFAFIVFLLALAGQASADIAPMYRAQRVRFDGELVVFMFRYTNYCSIPLNSDVYNLFGGERDIVSMPADSKNKMIGSLPYVGECETPNGMYVINGQGWTFFQKDFACRESAAAVAYQEKMLPGSYRNVSPAALQNRMITGDCTWDMNKRFCSKVLAQKARGVSEVYACVDDGDYVDVWLRSPETGEGQILTMTKAEVEKYERNARDLENINDDIIGLEWERAGCDAFANKGACATFLALAMMPERWIKAFGAFGTAGCLWVTGACVRIIDVKLKDLDYEKQKFLKEQEEREKEAKAKGKVANPSPSSGAATGTGGPGTVTGPEPSYPPVFPPVYDGEVIISEDPPGPMPGGGGTTPSHGSHM